MFQQTPAIFPHYFASSDVATLLHEEDPLFATCRLQLQSVYESSRVVWRGEQQCSAPTPPLTASSRRPTLPPQQLVQTANEAIVVKVPILVNTMYGWITPAFDYHPERAFHFSTQEVVVKGAGWMWIPAHYRSTVDHCPQLRRTMIDIVGAAVRAAPCTRSSIDPRNPEGFMLAAEGDVAELYKTHCPFSSLLEKKGGNLERDDDDDDDDPNDVSAGELTAFDMDKLMILEYSAADDKEAIFVEYWGRQAVGIEPQPHGSWRLLAVNQLAGVEKELKAVWQSLQYVPLRLAVHRPNDGLCCWRPLPMPCTLIHFSDGVNHQVAETIASLPTPPQYLTPTKRRPQRKGDDSIPTKGAVGTKPKGLMWSGEGPSPSNLSVNDQSVTLSEVFGSPQSLANASFSVGALLDARESSRPAPPAMMDWGESPPQGKYLSTQAPPPSTTSPGPRTPSATIDASTRFVQNIENVASAPCAAAVGDESLDNEEARAAMLLLCNDNDGSRCRRLPLAGSKRRDAGDDGEGQWQSSLCVVLSGITASRIANDRLALIHVTNTLKINRNCPWSVAVWVHGTLYSVSSTGLSAVPGTLFTPNMSSELPLSREGGESPEVRQHRLLVMQRRPDRNVATRLGRLVYDLTGTRRSADEVAAFVASDTRIAKYSRGGASQHTRAQSEADESPNNRSASFASSMSHSPSSGIKGGAGALLFTLPEQQLKSFQMCEVLLKYVLEDPHFKLPCWMLEAWPVDSKGI